MHKQDLALNNQGWYAIKSNNQTNLQHVNLYKVAIH